MKHLKIVISLLIIAFSTTALATGTRELEWSDLIKEITFEDPFEALTSEQLSRLGLYARVKSLIGNSPDRVSEAMQKEADEAEQRQEQHEQLEAAEDEAQADGQGEHADEHALQRDVHG